MDVALRLQSQQDQLWLEKREFSKAGSWPKRCLTGDVAVAIFETPKSQISLTVLHGNYYVLF